jgi:hypothetical protein
MSDSGQIQAAAQFPYRSTRRVGSRITVVKELLPNLSCGHVSCGARLSDNPLSL